MKEENEGIIEHYKAHITEIEEVIDKIDNDKLLDRQQRARFIKFLDKAVLHCRGMISVLDGTYQQKVRKEQ